MTNSKGTALERAETGTMTLEQMSEKMAFSPLVDVVETNDALEVLAELPGVSLEGLQVKLEDDVLTIYGRVTPDDLAEARPLYREFETGDFFRAFRLTGDFDRDRIEAILRNGVLRVVLTKSMHARPRQIDVKAI
jgi:HSP20 family protein